MEPRDPKAPLEWLTVFPGWGRIALLFVVVAIVTALFCLCLVYTFAPFGP